MRVKYPKLDRSQLDRLSEICSNLFVVFIAPLIAPFIFPNVDKPTSTGVVSSMLASSIFFILSIYLARKRK